MTIFDLLFIIAFLSLVIALVMATLQAIRGRRERALTAARRIGATAAAYFAAVAVVSIGTPRQVVPMGVAQCFDDWCITAVGATRQHAGNDDSMRVLLRLSSNARGITQGERDVRVYVIDDKNRQYAPTAEPGALPLSASIPPEGAVTPTRLFILPTNAGHPKLIVVHDWFPHCCIIADRESFLHRAAVVPLY